MKKEKINIYIPTRLEMCMSMCVYTYPLRLSQTCSLNVRYEWPSFDASTKTRHEQAHGLHASSAARFRWKHGEARLQKRSSGPPDQKGVVPSSSFLFPESPSTQTRSICLGHSNHSL